MVRSYKESSDQIAALDWLRLQHPEVALHTMHIGNERKTTPQMGAILKRMGVLKGVSDLFIAWPNGVYHGLFIEVKSKTGKVTPEQIAFTNRMKLKGYFACVCFGVDEIIKTITWYLKL